MDEEIANPSQVPESGDILMAIANGDGFEPGYVNYVRPFHYPGGYNLQPDEQRLHRQVAASVAHLWLRVDPMPIGFSSQPPEFARPEFGKKVY